MKGRAPAIAFKKKQSSYLEWSSENSERVEYIANKSPRKKKTPFQKEAPKLRSILSSTTTGRKFLATADIFSLQQLDVSKRDLTLGSKKTKASPKEQVKMNEGNSYRQLRQQATVSKRLTSELG